MTEKNSKVKVAYITGAGRSGTTLLDILLGQIDGFFSAGEMRWLWWGGLISGWQCGCSSPVRSCEIWRRIITTTFGRDLEDVDVHRVLRLQQSAMRLHQLPRLLAQSPNQQTRWPELHEYSDIMDALYRAIAAVNGAQLIVDSSKNAPDAALLRLLPNVDAYLIHLVRDSRGVANSFKRKVKMEPLAARTFDQPRRGAATSALIWDRKNVASEAVRLRFPPDRVRRVRYEDIVHRPRPALEEIAEFLGQPTSGLKFHGERTVELAGNHTAWGNPSRFRTGRIELRSDDEWLRKLPDGERRISTMLSLPLLLRYKYPIRKRA